MNEKLMTGSFDEVNAIFTCGTVIAQAGRQAGRQAVLPSIEQIQKFYSRQKAQKPQNCVYLYFLRLFAATFQLKPL